MIISIISFISALVLSFLLRFLARKKNLLDIPNDRSSHTIPTPKGGGLAIIITFVSVLVYMYFNEGIEKSLFFALLCVIPISLISIIDDIVTLSVRVRILVQLVSSVLALYMLGGIETVNIGVYTINGIWLNIVSLLTVLWLTNLYNFLDGLDGYAASEAVFVGLSAFILFQSNVGLFLAFSTLGFLVFNWPKASFFMGDVGSASLGFIFAILLLSDAGTSNFLGWIILLSLFWFDATVTLLRRVKNSEKLSQAHKKHMYQRLNQSGWSHLHVLLGGILFNVIVLVSLLIVKNEYYLYLLGSIFLLLWGILKYIDKQKEFE